MSNRKSASISPSPARVAQELEHPVVLFDGVCNVCNDSVKFILARDGQGYFRFASLQSEVAKGLLRPFGLEEMPLHTMVLIEEGRVFTKSTAVMRVARRLGALWPVVSFGMWLVPRPLRDALYSGFVKHRYRLFGKSEVCLVPTPALRERFLDLAPVRASSSA